MDGTLLEMLKDTRTAPLCQVRETFFQTTSSPSMAAVECVIRELSQSEIPVLLLGEPGSGKRITAERIHQMSQRRDEPFLIVDCADLSSEQFEAKADALSRRGTVLLHEPIHLNPTVQASLLEWLPKSGSNGRAMDRGARLIFASSHDLEAEVKSGGFREDLFYRMSGICLRLPPLRQRREDIPLLMSYFLRKYAEDFRRPVPALSPRTQNLFQHYAWPGNIRELEDAAKAIVALGDESLAMGGLRSVLMKCERSANGERVSLKEAGKAASREAEKELILRVLTKTRWNRRRAAQELQISYKALLYKLKQIGARNLEIPSA